MRFEWAHATDPFAVHTPAEVAELADDGNPRGEWGVSVMSGTDGVMLVGTPAELRKLLLRAHNALPPVERSDERHPFDGPRLRRR